MFLTQGRACQLAIGSVSNIVASGTLIEREAGNNFQVMITSVLKPTCPLPFAYSDLDMYIVAQAIGTPIAWPKDFVIISEDVTHEVMPYFYIIIFTILYLFAIFLIVDIIVYKLPLQVGPNHNDQELHQHNNLKKEDDNKLLQHNWPTLHWNDYRISYLIGMMASVSI